MCCWRWRERAWPVRRTPSLPVLSAPGVRKAPHVVALAAAIAQDPATVQATLQSSGTLPGLIELPITHCHGSLLHVGRRELHDSLSVRQQPYLAHMGEPLRINCTDVQVWWLWRRCSHTLGAPAMG